MMSTVCDRNNNLYIIYFLVHCSEFFVLAPVYMCVCFTVQVGDWKSHFSEEQSKEFDRVFHEKLDGTGLEHEWELWWSIFVCSMLKAAWMFSMADMLE